MKVIQFEDEAKQSCTSIELVRADFEKAIAEEKIHGLITPTKKAAICFEPIEIDLLNSALSCLIFVLGFDFLQYQYDKRNNVA